MKLEEQKSDLERQLKTLTKQIKVRWGYSRGRGRGLLHHFTESVPALGLETFEKLPDDSPGLHSQSPFPWHGPWYHRLALAGNKIKAGFHLQAGAL